MPSRSLLVPFTILLIGLTSWTGWPRSSRGDEASPVRDFLANHCLDCHIGEAAEASLDLDSLAPESASETAFATWDQVLRRVAAGEMPPSEAGQPTAAERVAFTRSLGKRLDEADRQRIAANGRSPVRRLSRTEYQNTLRDVLALPHLEVLESLPPDGNDHGFDKSSRALDFSHVHVARMLEVIDFALRRAIAPTVQRPEAKTTRATLSGLEAVRETCQGIYAQVKQGRAIPMIGDEADPTIKIREGNFQKRDPGSVEDPPPHFDGVAMFINGESNLNMSLKPFRVVTPGTYRLRVHGYGLLNEAGELSPSPQMETVGFYTDDRTLGYVDLPSDEPTTAELTVWLNAGDRIKPLVASSTYPIIRVGGKQLEGWRRITGRGVVFQWFELEGPIDKAWPPESHRRLFGDLPLAPPRGNGEAVDNANRRSGRSRSGSQPVSVVSASPLADSERLIAAFADRALRRPVSEDDLALPLGIAREKLEAGRSLTEALLSAYRAILASPSVVLLQEPVGPLPDHALASRLAYFLWASPPDQRLEQLADEGRLRDPQVLAEETDRLLDDPKANRFVNHFLDHWLKLREIDLTEPDQNLYPDYNPLLLDSMLGETRQFFLEMIREDLGVAHVVDSDFTFANQRLAELYGLSGVEGNELRRVSLPEGLPRGGLLTQASLMKVTANGTTTSPVTRGTFVMTQLLGDPPPPPPAAVPAIEPDISGATTIREQLAKHRSIESCAACHRKIDPPGLALESFDVMGGFRTRYRSVSEGKEIPGLLIAGGKPSGVREALPVDPSGKLPGGETFEDVEDFRQLLLERERQLADNLLRQFVVYATGSPVGHADEAEFRQMLDSLRDRGDGVRGMIHAVVQSEMFRRT